MEGSLRHIIKKQKQMQSLTFTVEGKKLDYTVVFDFEYIRKHWKDTQQKNNNG